MSSLTFLFSNKTKVILLNATLLFACLACKTGKTASDSTLDKKENDIQEVVIQQETETNSSDKVDRILFDNKWIATEIYGESIEAVEGIARQVELTFTEDFQFSGSGGCNSFFGTFDLKAKNFIHFNDIAMTEMACATPNFDEKLLTALNATQQYIIIKGQELHLIVGKRAALAKFRAIGIEE